MDEQLHERVREVIATVPQGTVASYGDIAAIAGAPSPRLVGRILAEDGHDLPWHRILRSDGTPAPHLEEEQLERLRAEGVLADGNRVNMRQYRWAAAQPKDEPGLF
ncbi:MGMT family protein [Kibdelosporangium aridum]|uniref:Alkylated DNA nucleotide flippase Atl1, participates in nucleotide excision repair, Ada-like DNA-binding domain n=1 Tax=Kibdelosporangium aridum TaxID=2030 RepID=A0A1W2F2W9_KIBAR|nr:MGMT family protein [Kibdelosporangium aridum]SMD16299.1 Alkylated DNA nucleotide flippase Atl1, participates in nucleotide excision repair, Ada-like DNA-binding domain [Kibdelosporangium aridum]